MPDRSVRQEFAREFRGLRGHSLALCWLILFGYILQAIAAAALGYLMLDQPLTVYTGLGIALAVLFIGTRLRGLNNIVHECSHFTFSEVRDVNTLFGKICCALIFKSYQDYRVEHMSHHTHLGDYEHDLDFHIIRDLRIEDPLTPRTILRHIIAPFLGRHLPYYVSLNFSAKDGLAFAVLKLVLAGAALVFAALDPIAALVLVFLPFFFVFSAINYWTDCIDHGGLFGSDTELDGSRNVLVPAPIRFLFFPRNDCYHLIHHLFPHVPVRHFDTCHAKLLANPEYRERKHEPSLRILPLRQRTTFVTAAGMRRPGDTAVANAAPAAP